MLPHSASAPQSARRFGVGIDTSRYGHYAAFLRDDLQPAADELQFAESAEGYGRLRQRFERFAEFGHQIIWSSSHLVIWSLNFQLANK